MKANIFGHEFEVAKEPADFWQWVANGRYDNEWRLLSAHLKPAHTFVDLGAWVGSHSLYASATARRVVSVEPDPVAFEILKTNTSGTGIETHRLAIGADGELKMGSSCLGWSTTRVNPMSGGIIEEWAPDQTFVIESHSLRRFLNIVDAKSPLFLKIDIEGSEEQVVKDIEFFEQYRPTALVELHPFWWTDSETEQRFDRIKRLYPNHQQIGNHLLLA